MLHFHISSNTSEDCADYLVSTLQSHQGKPTLLLWSGGSATKIAGLLTNKLNRFVDLSWLTLSLVDERYGQLGHKDSNEVLIQSTGIIDEVTKQGGNWEKFLTGLSFEAETKRLNQIFTKYFQTHTVVGIFGIGEDGHTAGILPIFDNQSEFDKLFNSDQYVVEYDLEKLKSDYPNQFKQRITLSLSGLTQLNQRIVFAQGEKKREVIQKLKADSQELFLFPAQIFNKTESELFTDQIDLF